MPVTKKAHEKEKIRVFFLKRDKEDTKSLREEHERHVKEA